MKSILSTLLPAMALLALGGCASTSALTTTESDGVYYSSKDHTTYTAPARATASVQDSAPESTASDAEANPDYSSSNSSSKSSTQSGGSEYYDDDYGYSARIRRFHQPVYRSFGYGYNDFIYSDPFWYGGSAYSYYGGGYSPYGWGPGYYDPFYGPYYGSSAVIINIGFGRPYYNPWRYGGYGYGYGGYGYGGGYRQGYYDGYRNGGGYGGNYYGGGNSRNNVPYTPRGNRSQEATASGRASTGTGVASPGRSRTPREGGVAAPVDGVTNASGGSGTNNPTYNGRSRAQAAGNATNGVTPDARVGRSLEDDAQTQGRTAVFEDERGRQVDSRSRESLEQPRTTETGSNGRRWRVVENAGGAGSQPASSPTYSEQRRSRSRQLSEGEQNAGQSNGTQAVEQPVRRQRTYEAPQRSDAPQRTYEAPQRSYEAPSRSSSEPSRSSSPSMNSGGTGGGGRSSGGGRGRGE